MPSTDVNSTQIAVAGVEFSLTGSSLTSSAIDLHGAVTIPELAGLSLAVTGANHLAIDSTGVHLSGLNASIAKPESLSIAGQALTLQSLAIQYSAAGNEIQISGSGSLKLLQQTVAVTFGTAQQPGIVIQNGTLSSFDLALGTKSSFSAAGITITPQSLHASYTQNTGTLAISGNAAISVGSLLKNVTLDLGGDSTPGLVIQNGSLQSLDGSITAASIAIAGLTFSNVSLAVDYQAGPQDLAISGGATFMIPGTKNKVTVQLGSTAAYGHRNPQRPARRSSTSASRPTAISPSAA